MTSLLTIGTVASAVITGMCKALYAEKGIQAKGLRIFLRILYQLFYIATIVCAFFYAIDIAEKDAHKVLFCMGMFVNCYLLGLMGYAAITPQKTHRKTFKKFAKEIDDFGKWQSIAFKCCYWILCVAFFVLAFTLPPTPNQIPLYLCLAAGAVIAVASALVITLAVLWVIFGCVCPYFGDIIKNKALKYWRWLTE